MCPNLARGEAFKCKINKHLASWKGLLHVCEMKLCDRSRPLNPSLGLDLQFQAGQVCDCRQVGVGHLKMSTLVSLT